MSHSVHRLFAFGCSFTNYLWDSWPEVLAYDLDCGLWNFGKSGAGNQFIFNHFIQALNHYKFNANDLVIICWTNVLREDRYIKREWWTPGNILKTNYYYDQQFIDKYVDPEGFLLRDMALIDSATKILSHLDCQSYQLCMSNLSESYIPIRPRKYGDQTLVNNILELYKESLSKILPGYVQVLWKGTMNFKAAEEYKLFGDKFWDLHPTVQEHLDYLKIILNHKFKQSTIDKVKEKEQEWLNLVNYLIKQKSQNGLFTFHHLDQEQLSLIKEKLITIKSNKLFDIKDLYNGE